MNNIFFEFVNINGIGQFLLHYPCVDKDSPVLLFLHGGPGMAESVFAHDFQPEMADLYTVVHWDQRGAGKTLAKNKRSYPTMEELLDDLHKVIEYLKRKYNKKKIIIMGHSFGSILGSLYALKCPEDVLCYIGVGQVVSIFENEQAGYKKLQELIIASGNKKDLSKLEKIGTYPENNYNKAMIKKIQTLRILQGKYRIGMNFIPIIKTFFKSPIFKISDIVSLMRGMSDNVPLWEYMFSHSLENESLQYQVPVFYILGGADFQAPHTIAERYFDKINAPQKQIFIIENAGHFIMLDDSKQFGEVLSTIKLTMNL